MRPRILISTDTNSDKFANYVRAIESAGGEAVPVREADSPDDARAKADTVDGWLIIGGRDLPPIGEQWHEKSEPISNERLAIENALFDIFDKSEKPILGICMGAQYLNFKSEGSLIQHIPDIGKHGHGAQSDKDEETKVQIDPDSLLARLIGISAVVRCHHHQAIGIIGKGYRAVAWEDTECDRIVEAIEDESGRWRIGVQWHPERTPAKQSNNLFQAFVQACATQRLAPSRQE